MVHVESLINKYNWKRINYPSEVTAWEISEEKSITVALNVLAIKI